MIGTWFSSPTVWENQRLPPNAARSGLPNPQHLGTISCFLKQVLKDESKAAIEKEFNELGSRTTLPNGWDNANSVFEKARKALDWRYGIQLGDKRLTYYEPLYIAALSVYKTTPLWGLRCTVNEIMDPVIKEDLIHRITLG